MNIRLQTT